MSFENNIQSWVQIDNKIKLLTEEAKQLRAKKSVIMDDINCYIQQKNLENAVINISDGQLKFAKSQTIQGLTLKFVENCLMEILHDEKKTEYIMDFIKSKREVKIYSNIKRIYK